MILIKLTFSRRTRHEVEVLKLDFLYLHRLLYKINTKFVRQGKSFITLDKIDSLSRLKDGCMGKPATKDDFHSPVGKLMEEKLKSSYNLSGMVKLLRNNPATTVSMPLD